MAGRIAYDHQARPYIGSPQIVNLDLGRLERPPWMMEGDLWLVLPAFSPDGGHLAYTYPTRSSDWANQAVYVGPAHGFGVRRITPARYGTSCPCWSPDNSQVAYLGPGTNPGVRAIRAVGADGSGDRVIWEGNDPLINRITWSPQGILGGPHAWPGTAMPTTAPFMLLAPDGSGGTTLHPTVHGDPSTTVIADPAWAPNGSAIAYLEHSRDPHQGSLHRLCVLDWPDPGASTVIYETARPMAWPAWSPDSQQIVFSIEVGPHNSLFTILRSGADFREVLLADGSPIRGVGELYPNWGPRGPAVPISSGPPGVLNIPLILDRVTLWRPRRRVLFGVGPNSTYFVDPLFDPPSILMAALAGGVAGYAVGRAMAKK